MFVMSDIVTARLESSQGNMPMDITIRADIPAFTGLALTDVLMATSKKHRVVYCRRELARECGFRNQRLREQARACTI
jgi:hypothetical protein